ncbi:MAG TPA: GSCFA domain-containing protein [Bacteroidales bacterium]|nr:GSCFA domain-containing protein [Bacteroidales bacterium]
MEFRTAVKIERSPATITYNDPVMFIGSCFAQEIGERLFMGKMPVFINPAGTVYNPISVINTLGMIISGKEIKKEDITFYKGTWLSFLHYTDFTSDDPSILLERINARSAEALRFLKQSHFLFVTFGTARVFRLKETGRIVSNCHKLPPSYFERELLDVDYIVSSWNKQLDELQAVFPDLKVIFTISPVRHWKDGAHGNQVSKSVLFLAVEELLKHSSSPLYFPAYEIIMDDLRDYRFYKEDMIHPSEVAVGYIWDAFCRSYLDDITISALKEVSKISEAMKHRIREENSPATKEFARNMLNRISQVNEKYPYIDFSREKIYFSSITNG